MDMPVGRLKDTIIPKPLECKGHSCITITQYDQTKTICKKYFICSYYRAVRKAIFKIYERTWIGGD